MNKHPLLIPLWTFLLFSCNAQEPAPIIEAGAGSVPAGSHYVKPGADIQLLNPVVPQLAPGQVKEVSLLLGAGYQEGRMTVQVTATEGLEIVAGATEVSFPLAAAQDYRLPLHLYAAEAGRYYVNLLANVQLPDGALVSRAFSVAIQVGAAERVRENEKVGREQDGVLVMPAEESVY